MAGLHLRVEGQAQLQAVIDALSEEERGVGDNARQAIRDKAQEVAQRARDRVQGEPIHGVKQTGLRARIAAGTTVDDTADGAEIAAGLSGDEANLPEDMDHGSWMHPVFGNQNNWVTQSGYFAWFSDTMDESDGDFEDALDDVLDQAAERIAGA